jgi:hypothetical protein
MKCHWEKLIGLVVIGTVLAACSAPALAPTSVATTTASEPPAIPLAATATPAATPTTLPPTVIPASPTSPAATSTPDPNAKTYQFNGIHLVIPSALARSAAAKLVPAVSANKEQAWLVAPQFVRITLAGYASPKGSYLTPEIFVYPAQDYAADNAWAQSNLQKLQAILSNPPAALTNDILPWLPFTPGEQSMAAQAKVIPFKGGSGIRVLTQYDIFQDPMVTAPGDPIVNRLLFYHFEGLNTDGKSYIVAVLPVGSALLANDPDPNAFVPAGGVAYPGLGTDVAHFDYFKAITDLLNGESPEAFSPSLTALDAMIESINVSP